MENFKYFKPIKNLQFKYGQAELDLEPSSYEVDLFNYSLAKAKNFNFIADFDEQTLEFLKNSLIALPADDSFSYLEINEIDAGFMSDYAGTTAYEPALLVSASFKKNENNKILLRHICFGPFVVGVVNKYEITENFKLTKLWRDYLTERYGQKYVQACARFDEKQTKEKAQFLSRKFSNN